MSTQNPPDAIFPVLPRWFTEPLRAHRRGRPRSDGLQRTISAPAGDTSDLDHEHELLESLFKDVYARRYINMSPTCESGGKLSLQLLIFPHVSSHTRLLRRIF